MSQLVMGGFTTYTDSIVRMSMCSDSKVTEENESASVSPYANTDNATKADAWIAMIGKECADVMVTDDTDLVKNIGPKAPLPRLSFDSFLYIVKKSQKNS